MHDQLPGNLYLLSNQLAIDLSYECDTTNSFIQ